MLTYLVVMILWQQAVENRHGLEADIFVRRQVKGSLRQVWQILKINGMLLFWFPAAACNSYKLCQQLRKSFVSSIISQALVKRSGAGIWLVVGVALMDS